VETDVVIAVIPLPFRHPASFPSSRFLSVIPLPFRHPCEGVVFREIGRMESV